MLRDTRSIDPRRLALLVVMLGASVASGASTTDTRECVDPCIQAARGARRACVSSAVGAFLDALGGCADRDPGCLAACRAKRQSCREDTSLGAELAACEFELIQAQARCRDEHRPGSIRRAICIGRSEARSYRCQRQAVRGAKREIRACDRAFVGCAESCGPGSPPGGADGCRGEARSELAAARAACRTTFRVTTGGCLGKDITCVQDCAATSETCEAVPRASLAAALASCDAERNAGLAACQGANPDGGQPLDDCQDAVWASAFVCREVAVEAAAPGFALCADAYVACVRACPSA